MTAQSSDDSSRRRFPALEVTSRSDDALRKPEPSVANDLVFKGTSGEECEEFISAVRRKAFAEGKQLDNQWIAQFAAISFSGKALRWHNGLDEATRQDWGLLEKAMLLEYTSDDKEKKDKGDNQGSSSSAATVAPAKSKKKKSHKEKEAPEEVVKFRAKVQGISPGILPGYIRAYPGDEVDVLEGTVGFARRCRLDNGKIGYIHSIFLQEI